jgi:single-strand DNA-binding protein
MYNKYQVPKTAAKDDAMSFHTIIIVGRLGRDPEMRYTSTGQALTSFSVATDRRYTDSNGQVQKQTIWFSISVWGKQAESCNNYLKKGNQVLIEGNLRGDPQTGGPRVYPRSDGTSGARYEVTAQTVRFLTPKSEGQDAGAAGAGAGASEEPQDVAGGDDIPF